MHTRMRCLRRKRMRNRAMMPNGISRRQLFQIGATAAATATLASMPATVLAKNQGFLDSDPDGLVEVTIAELQARMTKGKLTAQGLVKQYKARIEAIDRNGPKV